MILETERDRLKRKLAKGNSRSDSCAVFSLIRGDTCFGGIYVETDPLLGAFRS